ncbi:MAG: NTP transferase domain-containing protein [Chlamydiales bacterium]|nr:acylneuraminate cytidylyltransferase family protein [Chlamydiales bacterium]NCF71026.1 NTP transferase domain-containing protein [Chlamydiales bacterium]
MKHLAVIPARGGSTRLKDKNIHPLKGKPLVCYSVEAVLNSGCFDKVIVSTDSEKIKEVVKDYPVDIYDREAEFATCKITVLEAILDMMTKIPAYDTLSYFLPTCPFVSAEDIQQGFAMLTEGTDAVNCVAEYDVPIQLAMIKKGEQFIPVFDNLTSGLTNSNYIQKYYHPTGAFYMSWWKQILENRNFFKGNIKGYVLPKSRLVDINDLCDIEKAERMLKQKAISS